MLTHDSYISLQSPIQALSTPSLRSFPLLRMNVVNSNEGKREQGGHLDLQIAEVPTQYRNQAVQHLEKMSKRTIPPQGCLERAMRASYILRGSQAAGEAFP